MRLTPEQQRKIDGDMRAQGQVEVDRRAGSLRRLLRKAKPAIKREPE